MIGTRTTIGGSLTDSIIHHLSFIMFHINYSPNAFFHCSYTFIIDRKLYNIMLALLKLETLSLREEWIDVITA